MCGIVQDVPWDRVLSGRLGAGCLLLGAANRGTFSSMCRLFRAACSPASHPRRPSGNGRVHACVGMCREAAAAAVDDAQMRGDGESAATGVEGVTSLDKSLGRCCGEGAGAGGMGWRPCRNGDHGGTAAATAGGLPCVRVAPCMLLRSAHLVRGAARCGVGVPCCRPVADAHRQCSGATPHACAADLCGELERCLNLV